MNYNNTARLLAVSLFACVASFFVHSQPLIDLAATPELTAGKYTSYFQESDHANLTLEQAIAEFASNERLGKHQSISLGISVAPVWLKTRLLNSENANENYRISVETPWLDNIEAWIIHENKVVKRIRGGDAIPFQQRPMQYRYFAFETKLPLGESQLYLRVQTVGPMAIPLRISTSELAIKRDISSSYQYGFLYGIMVALALYNLILFFSVRLPEYGLYALYLLGFVINSLSYTGQLHTWITPDFGPYFQDWLDIFLMITYSIAGLHFARMLLQTKNYAPLLDKITSGVTIIIPAGMAIGFLFNNLTFSLILAFLLNTSFAVLFIVMGFKALQHKIAAAKLFLICSVTAASCICISTAAVAGLVPYNGVTFKLIEIGMAFEAICLAFLLAQRFRTAEVDKRVAETSARLDSLTGLNNRRGFAHVAQAIWYQEVRTGRDIAVVLIDIDHFKKINDGFGHAKGDEVLKVVASVLKDSARRSDIVARWGGEEFLILLPETSESQAVQHAERLREKIEKSVVESAAGPIKFTASFGVCGTVAGKFGQAPLLEDDLETMINVADEALYKVKAAGRNQVKAATQQELHYRRSKVKI